MRKPISILALTLLLATTHITTGHDAYKAPKSNHTAHNELKTTKHLEHRGRRSLDDEEDKPFWANRGKRSALGRNLDGDNPDYSRILEFSPADGNHLKFAENNVKHEAPFWGNRGRRDSKEIAEDLDAWQLKGRKEGFDNIILKKLLQSNRLNDVCFGGLSNVEKETHRPYLPEELFVSKERREEETNPFWGNRGRRASEEDIEESPFWGNRGRRDDDGPFWGARGRRDEDSPFWGARGRREEDSPFWGARGRREENSPFWGARGRREEDSPFWGARGRRDEVNPFWGNRGRRSEEDDTDSLLDALKNIKYELRDLARSKRNAISNVDSSSFWGNRGRTSALQYLFNDQTRGKPKTSQVSAHPKLTGHKGALSGFTSMKSLRQDRLYADQPYYIIVDRSSRSIVDDDPYFIARGKKKMSLDFAKAARDRRGIIEQIAKTVQDDPYFAVRGKKDDDGVKSKGQRYEHLMKARELICSAVILMNSKKDSRTKRELSLNRRAILKKLAAQLQNDPYFVSRGKKNADVDMDEDKLEEFIKQITEMCS